MKKILIFSTAYAPYIGGAEVAVKELTSRLAASRANLAGEYRFDMITARLSSKLPKFETIGRIDVYRIGVGWPIFDKYWLAFCGHYFAGKLHKKNKYDAVWSIMASYAGFAAMFFKQRNNIPFLLTLQEGDDLSYVHKRVGIFKSWFKNIFLSADIIQPISHYLATWAKANGAAKRIEVIPNGVDLAVFARSFTDDEYGKLKKEIGKNEGDIFIIHTGRLVKKNGLENIVRSLAYLPVNFKFLSVGSGPESENLKLLAEDLNLSNRIILIEYVNHEQMVKYLKISDIFVRPSLSEGLGNSFLEAMAAGLPVIGTPVGGIPDFIKDKETGLFSAVNNPQDLAQKIELICNNNALRHKLVNNGFNLVQEKYNWDKIAASYAVLLNSLF